MLIILWKRIQKGGKTKPITFFDFFFKFQFISLITFLEIIIN